MSNLEDAVEDFFRRLKANEVTSEEARSALAGMSARLDLLRNVLLRIEPIDAFEKQCEDVRWAIQEQLGEIREIETYLQLGKDGK